MSAVAWTGIKNAIVDWMVAGSGLPASRFRWGGQNAPEPAGTSQAWVSLRISQVTMSGWDWNAYAARPLNFTAKPFTLDDTANVLLVPLHTLTTRSGPIRLTTTGSLAGTGVATGTDYWWIRTDDNTAQLATSFANADAGVFIDILGVGTGVHSVVSTPDTVTAGQELTEYARGARRVQVSVTCFPPQPTTDSSEALAILTDIVASSYLTSISEALSAANIGMIDPGQPQAVDGILNSVYFEPRATMTVMFHTVSEVSATQTIIAEVQASADGVTDAAGDSYTIDIDVTDL